MNIENGGTATFALRQAMTQPQLLLDVLRQSLTPTESLARQEAPPPPPADGRGRLVNILV